MGFDISDCVRMENGHWLCWDKNEGELIEITFKPVAIEKCDTGAVKALLAKLSEKRACQHDDLS